jgi:hypothetical protein
MQPVSGYMNQTFQKYHISEIRENRHGILIANTPPDTFLNLVTDLSSVEFIAHVDQEKDWEYSAKRTGGEFFHEPLQLLKSS